MARSFLSCFCPDLSANRLTKLVEWCDCYSPLVSQDGNDGVILDITGCAHLFGGEEKLLADLHRRLQRREIQSRAAIADSPGAAWALARYGDRFIAHGEDTAAALDPLPVEALRLPVEISAELRRLGLLHIAHVRGLPRQSLSARFDPVLLLRLDRAFSRAEEPLTPWRPPALYRASRTSAEPISTIESVEYVLHELMQEICARLEKDHFGSRRMEFACYRVDGVICRCEARTSKPNRSIPHLMKLFHDGLEKLWAGFGFEAFTLSIPDAEIFEPIQFSLTEIDPVKDEESFDALVDRLGMKLGFDAVNRVRLRESLFPEYSVEFQPAVAATAECAEWPEYRIRPVRMFHPPVHIEVSILIPGESPVQFFIGRQRHRIVRSEGPERLTPEWWREDDSQRGERDYYRIEDEQGLRLWIFHESGRWFLHGQLP